MSETVERITSLSPEGTQTKVTYKVESSDIEVNNQPVNRYAVMSKIPVLTNDEIMNSIEVHLKVNDILKEILINNDKQLICNILDTSKKIILSQNQLLDLLLTVLKCADASITKDSIRIKYSEDILSSCLKSSISPFKNIVSIKVLEQELSQTQPEIYAVLSGTMKISLDTFYAPVL